MRGGNGHPAGGGSRRYGRARRRPACRCIGRRARVQRGDGAGDLGEGADARLDTVMFCLSRDWARRVGSMLVGSRETSTGRGASQWRWAGGMRKAGVLAAGGLDRASKKGGAAGRGSSATRLVLADAVFSGKPKLEIDHAGVQTNHRIFLAKSTERARRTLNGGVERPRAFCSRARSGQQHRTVRNASVCRPGRACERAAAILHEELHDACSIEEVSAALSLPPREGWGFSFTGSLADRSGRRFQ